MTRREIGHAMQAFTSYDQYKAWRDAGNNGGFSYVGYGNVENWQLKYDREQSDQSRIAKLEEEVERLKEACASMAISGDNWDAAIDAAAALAQSIPHYTTSLIGNTGISCDISTPPSEVATRIRTLKRG